MTAVVDATCLFLCWIQGLYTSEPMMQLSCQLRLQLHLYLPVIPSIWHQKRQGWSPGVEAAVGLGICLFRPLQDLLSIIRENSESDGVIVLFHEFPHTHCFILSLGPQQHSQISQGI